MPSDSESTTEDISDVSEAVDEYRDRERRKTNVIFHNIKESTKDNNVDRKKEVRV